MPKTFSDADVIRIWCKHLTLSEQIIVLFVFVFIVPRLILEKALESKFIDLFRVLRLTKRILLSNVVVAAVDVVIRQVLPKRVVKILDKCFGEEIESRIRQIKP